MTSTEKTRPQNELEGSLLSSSDNFKALPDYSARPPLPPQISPDYYETEVVEAVPLLPLELDGNLEAGIDVSSFTGNEGILKNGKGKTVQESRKIQTGTTVGLIEKSQEHFEIGKGNRNATFKQINESEKLKLANQVAQIRIREETEGSYYTEVTSLELNLCQKGKEQTITPIHSESKTSSIHKEDKAGYKASEYKISEYDTSAYACSEYKSIYD